MPSIRRATNEDCALDAAILAAWALPYEPDPKTESLLIDLHKICASRHIQRLACELYPYVANFPNVSPKDRMVRKHLRLIILNLLIAWRFRLWVAYPADNNAYSQMKGRYYALGITRQLPIIMRALAHAGYVVVKRGFKDKASGRGFISRAKASDKLIPLLSPIKPRKILNPKKRECIILNGAGVDAYGEPKDYMLINYDDTPETDLMRRHLVAYNNLIQSSDITLDEAAADLTGLVDFYKIFTYRVFNRGSFDVGGRFYGPWWVTLPSRYDPNGNKVNNRQHIRINGNAVIELDYGAQHPALLYARTGIPLDFDPYQIPGYGRALIKQAMLINLNATTRHKAASALRQWAMRQRKEMGLHERFQIPPGMMDDIEQAHTRIREFFYKEAWTFLQRQDSNIAERVMNHFTAKGTPVLMVHDSFLVERQHGDELHQVMSDAMTFELSDYGVDLKPLIKPGWEEG